MEYRNLGNTDLKVSAFCLGCMGFGEPEQGMHKWTLPYDDSKEIISQALDAGINFFDTAMAYQSGTSEEFVGRALRELSNRDKVVVATKFTPRTEEEKNSGISGQKHVEQCLDASLKRLGMDYVDLYICHMWDYGTPIEEIMEGLHNAVTAGKARYIGISNCFAYQLERANRIAEKNGWEPFVSVQGHYNLLFREEEREESHYERMEQKECIMDGAVCRFICSCNGNRMRFGCDKSGNVCGLSDYSRHIGIRYCHHCMPKDQSTGSPCMPGYRNDTAVSYNSGCDSMACDTNHYYCCSRRGCPCNHKIYLDR